MRRGGPIAAAAMLTLTGSAAGEWARMERRDAASGDPSVSYRLESHGSVLVVACAPIHAVAWTPPAPSELGGADRVDVRYRFDGGRPVTRAMQVADGRVYPDGIAGSGSAGAFYELLRKSDRVVLEIPGRSEPTRFELGDLAARIDGDPVCGRAGRLVSSMPALVEPKLIADTRIEPRYPERARELGLGGRVRLSALVKKDGTLGDVAVVVAEPSGVGFEEAAVEAVLAWRYEPATMNGIPVEMPLTLSIEFRPR